MLGDYNRLQLRILQAESVTVIFVRAFPDRVNEKWPALPNRSRRPRRAGGS